MKQKIEKMLLIGAIICAYEVLYAPDELKKEGKIGGEIEEIEGVRGWDEDGINLWTGAAPLPDYNVGIGTSNPAYKLDVAGSSRIQGNIYINSWPISVTSTPLVGYVLKWDGTAFIPAVDENSGGNVSGSGSAAQIAFWTGTNTIGGSNNLWWDVTNVRLGIGTTNPTQALTVSKEDNSILLLGPNSTWGYSLALGSGADANFPPNTPYISTDNGGLHITAINGSGISLGYPNSNFVSIWSGGSSGYVAFYVAASGNVGIGTTDPAGYKLRVAGNIRGSAFVDEEDANYYLDPTGNSRISVIYANRVHTNNWFRSQGPTGWYNEDFGGGWYMNDAIWIKNFNSKPIYITGNGGVAGTFMNGNLGIGTTAPAYLLDVTGTSRIQGDIYINSWPISITSAPGANYVLKWNGTAFVPQPEAGLPPGTSGQTLRHDGTKWVANDLLFNNGTNIGIGTTAPAYLLDIAGNCHATGFWSSSDIRFKKDIKNLENVLEKIKKIRGVTFKWNETHNKLNRSKPDDPTYIGVIAQEVQEVFPELISTWKAEDGNTYLAVEYGRLAAVLLEAIKEQQKEIDKLQKEIEELKVKITNKQ
ncbi:MAG: tail fiber domain-containing protein [candidate division WOR-3 bacterium]